MFAFLEKWAIKRLFKRIAAELPNIEGKLAQIWEEHSEEIIQKVGEAITKIIKKALEKQ